MDDDFTKARILRTQRILGGKDDTICRHCDAVIMFDLPHEDDCVLRKINPESLKGTAREVSETYQKNINKRRIFKSDKPRWSGLPAPLYGTLVRKRSAHKDTSLKEIKKCRTCGERVLFVNERCSRCEHIQPCAYVVGVNCQLCYPGR